MYNVSSNTSIGGKKLSHRTHCTSKRNPGKHLSYSDRQIIEWAVKKNEKLSRKKRLNQKELADILEISPSTLSRELRRGRVKQLDTYLVEYYSYSALVAQQDYDYKASAKGPGLKIGDDLKLAAHIERKLLGIDAEGRRIRPYSPDACIMEFEHKGWPTKTRICTRTLYHYIEKDVFCSITQKDLPRGGQRKRRKSRRVRRSYKVPTGRQIEDRPCEAENRTEYGHWEMDCIESIKSDRTCILSLVERYSREAILVKLSSQTQDAVIRALNSLERSLGSRNFRDVFKTITVDNGSEFWDWESLETSILNKKARTAIYYAHPYSSWERGSNENLNGFVRYFIPKGTRISDYKQKEIQELAEWINDYPRRILKGQTAAAISQAARAA